MGEFMLNTFIFTDPDERDPTHCETNVSVVEEPNIFNKEICWKLKLESKYSNGKTIEKYSDAIEHASHPFSNYRDKSNMKYFKGFTVIKNEMTTKMIEFLMMDNSELSRYTSTITPQSYRRSILKNLIEYID